MKMKKNSPYLKKEQTNKQKNKTKKKKKMKNKNKHLSLPLFLAAREGEHTCRSDQITCVVDGRCVMKHYACDGKNDCGDWSDERDCNTSSCNPNDFR